MADHIAVRGRGSRLEVCVSSKEKTLPQADVDFAADAFNASGEFCTIQFVFDFFRLDHFTSSVIFNNVDFYIMWAFSPGVVLPSGSRQLARSPIRELRAGHAAFFVCFFAVRRPFACGEVLLCGGRSDLMAYVDYLMISFSSCSYTFKYPGRLSIIVS